MSIEQHHTSAVEFIKTHVRSWKDISIDNTSINLLTGNSNKVYLVSTSLQISPNKFIYRIFGPDYITNKSRERRIFHKLSSLGYAPKTYGESPRERIEQYLENYLPMSRPMFHEPQIIDQIAKRLRVLHSIDMSEVLSGESIISIENPRRWREFCNNRISTNPNFIHKIEVRDEIQDLLDYNVFERFNSILPKNSPVVYSHLDPSSLNFLYNAQNNQVYFIDFEFSGFSYRSMDFGLALNEVTFDFLYDKYPYWKHCPELSPTDGIVEAYVRAYGEGAEMWVEVKQALIAAHYIWAI